MTWKAAVCISFAMVAWALPSATLREAWEGGRRAETLDWFRREFFGYAPGRPADEKFDAEGVSFCGGRFKIRIHTKLPEGASAESPVPAFILIDHYNGAEREDHLWHRPNTPTNAIVGRGYAYVNFNVNDVALNCYDDRWSNKVHQAYGVGAPDSWGTISAWAWAVSRVMDWIERQPAIDSTRVGVVGHSRGGKTALWAAAQDERIAMAVPNGSGTGGARLMSMRLPKAEPLDWMLNHTIKFWFCPNAQKFKGGAEYTLKHDADDLIRLVCPRLVYVGSGSEDDWAGPEGEFEAARRASDLWRAYGYGGLSSDEFPRAGTCLNDGRVGYMLHKGPHALTPWNWNAVLDFADRHMKRRTPAGLSGRTASTLDRIDQFNARAGSGRLLEMSAWRGERVHAQTVVWSDLDEKSLDLVAGGLVSRDGSRIAADRVTGRFVRTASTKLRPSGAGRVTVGDCLDPAAAEWPNERFRAVWWTVDVPADAKAGTYSGEVAVRGASGEVRFQVALTVLDRQLPPAKDRRFFLDLWQHPWCVARHYGVKPFSAEHYRRLEPLYRELAAAGQKSVDATITDFPWGEGYAGEEGEIRTMVKSFRRADGSWRYDYADLDSYVEFARGCGLGPQIHLYTIVKFNEKHAFYYVDEATGERRAEELYEGTPAYEDFLTPLLKSLVAHLREKGWLDDSYIAIDEVAPERLLAARQFLKRVAPELKFAIASNVDPLRYGELTDDTDVMSQLLWTGHGISTLFADDFAKFMAARRERGQITTFYVCTQPQKPNTWFESPLAETAWLGLYAAAKRFDGFLRWATFLWGRDPFGEPGVGRYPTGENFLLYPGGLASVRWELLRDSIEDWEKIRILREKGDASAALEKALGRIDYFAVNADGEAATRAKVEAVWRELNFPSPRHVSARYLTPGLIGGMGPAATCDLMKKVIDVTDASDDQHHVHMLVDQNTDVPDRTAAILKGGADPMPQLIASAKRLEAAGADFLCMSCNTAHYFHGRLQEHVRIPVLNMPEESARELRRRGVRKVGLLATDGTIRTGVYHRYLQAAGIEVLVPGDEGQKAIMSLIYDCVKKGVPASEYPKDAVAAAVAELKARGAEAFLMACTELPIAFEALGYGEGFVDPTLVLARAIVREAGAPLRK